MFWMDCVNLIQFSMLYGTHVLTQICSLVVLNSTQALDLESDDLTEGEERLIRFQR